MYKSCDYCRHRKKRCVVPHASARCSDCEHLDLPCKFSSRLPSAKRKQTSRQIAARIAAAESADPETTSSTENDDNTREVANLKEGDCQLPLAGRGDMANKRLFQPRDTTADSRGGVPNTSETYWRDIHPFWPFITPEMLGEGGFGEDSDLKRCVHLAGLLSLSSIKDTPDLSLQIEAVVSILQQDRLSMTTMAGTLLLAPFIHYDDRLLQKASFSCRHVLREMELTSVWPDIRSY